MHDTSGNAGTNDDPPNPPGFVKGEKPPAGENVGTVYEIDENGKSHYYGYYPASNPYPSNKGTETPADVFKRGAQDGATHPGQTMGKIGDIVTGDKSKTNENNGKKVDKVLEQLPFVSDALAITQGAAGEKNADGSPKLPAPPSVQPDEKEGSVPGSPKPAGETKAPEGKAPASGTGSKPVESSSANSGAEGPKSAAGPAEKTPATGTKSDNTATSAAHPDAAPKASPSGEPAKLPIPTDYAYATEPKGNLEADPNSPGVFKDQKGQSYIQANNQDIPVQFDKDNGTWRAYRPDDPAKPQIPVKLDAKGNWEVHDNVGLKGGAPTGGATGGGEASGNNMANRERVADAASNSATGNTPGAYPTSVNVVNSMLKKIGIDLSTQSADKIVDNIKQVDAGTLTHAAASSREVWAFARDVADTSLPMKDRAAAAFGMVLNGVAAPASHAEFDLQNYHFGKNQDADLRRSMQMFMQFDPHA